jgi:hypothetical protein
LFVAQSDLSRVGIAQKVGITNPPLIDIVKERKRNADGVCPCGFHVSGDEETNVVSVFKIQGNRQNLSQDKNYSFPRQFFES